MLQDYENSAFGCDIKDDQGATISRPDVGHTHGNRKGSYILPRTVGKNTKEECVANVHRFPAVLKTNGIRSPVSSPAAASNRRPYGTSVGPIAQGIRHRLFYGIGHGTGYGIGHRPTHDIGYNRFYCPAHFYEQGYGPLNDIDYRVVYGLGHGAPYGIVNYLNEII